MLRVLLGRQTRTGQDDREGVVRRGAGDVGVDVRVYVYLRGREQVECASSSSSSFSLLLVRRGDGRARVWRCGSGRRGRRRRGRRVCLLVRLPAGAWPFRQRLVSALARVRGLEICDALLEVVHVLDAGLLLSAHSLPQPTH